MPRIEVLAGADEVSWSGMGGFRLAGKSSPDDVRELQQRLEQDFGIFTVACKGLPSGYCVRITPQLFSNAQEISALTAAMPQLHA
jgi:isopenicillin-N epimerase